MTMTKSSRLDMIGGREFRTFATKLEARDIDGLEFRVEGYASVVDTPYDMGSYEETISRSAFAKTLSMRPDVQLLVNHEGLPLARTTVAPGQPGHLQLSEDSRGLRFAAQLDRNDPDAQTLMRKVGAGLMDQASFAFRVIRQSWNDAHTLRTILEVSLDRGDVSIVNYGASPTTSVDARSLGQRGTGNLSLYQARARALALGVPPSPRHRTNLDFYRAQDKALGGRR
jgi:HK97 family phage prohead protease